MLEPFDARWRAWLSLPKQILLLYRSIWLHHCEFEIPGQERLAAVYIGESVSLSYYLNLYRAESIRTRRIPFWRMRSAISKARAAVPVVMVETNRLLHFLLPADGLRTESWVRMETDLSGELYQRRRRGIERGWGQKIRRHGYRYNISGNDSDLVRFYDEYYLPHVKYRHGEHASYRSIDELRRAFRKGFLLQVWEGDNWVSGLLVRRGRDNRVALLASGLHISHRNRMQAGGLSAAFYFLFQWAQANGVGAVDFRGSRVHRLDGVYRHKILWAAVPLCDPWHHTEITFFLGGVVVWPEVITQQLISRGDGFVTVAETDSAPHETI